VDLDGLDPNRMPRHVACVMDGNGRWATKQGLPRTEGHRAGEDALFDTICGALDLGIGYFTVYAFSTENWRRPHEEVRFLLNVIADDLLTRRRDELHQMGVKIRFIGRRDWRVPRWIARRMDEATALTHRNQAMNLIVAFNYGGRAEILDAARSFSGGDEDAFRSHLYAPEMHDPDLIIRTSGERRLSNYLLWQSAYSELVFRDELWPDFSREAFEESLAEFAARQRRFGGR
jgi:undecaprenyl diphosphate synthase